MRPVLISIYFLVVGWTGIVLGSDWFRPYVIVGLLLSIAVGVSALFAPSHKLRISSVDIVVYLFVVWLLMSLFFAGFNRQSFNYLLAYCFVFGVGYGVVRIAIGDMHRFRLAMDANVWAVLFVCAFALFEFLWKLNGFGSMAEFLPKIKPDQAAQSIGGLRLPRTYSLMPEPGILGFYLNTLGILALGWLYQNKRTFKFMLTVFLMLVVYVMSGSAGAIGSLFLGILSFVLTWFCGPLRAFLKKSRIIIFALFVMSGIAVCSISDWSALSKLSDPATYSGSRFASWGAGWRQFQLAGLAGNGLGYVATTQSGSFINWYLTLGVDGGWMATFMAMGLVATALVSVWKSNSALKGWYFVGICAGAVQLNSIATFFNPFLWALIAVFVAEHGIRDRRVDVNGLKGGNTCSGKNACYRGV